MYWPGFFRKHAGMTCPLLRQHGARDHTCPWFYGPETEKIIEDVIKLRHAMKPYYTAELNKLNETGRPFNRPLMWDFPGTSICCCSLSHLLIPQLLLLLTLTVLLLLSR